MRRSPVALVSVALLSLALVGALPRHASAQTGGSQRARLTVLWIDGTTLQDWSDPSLKNFQGLLDDAAVGLLTPGARLGGDVRAMRATVAETFGAGRHRIAEPPYATDPSPNIDLAPLGAGIVAASRSAVLISGTRALDRIDPAPARALGVPSYRAAVRTDRAFPTGSRTDIDEMLAGVRDTQGTDLRIVDFADVARVEHAVGDDPAARARWATLSMRRADRVLGAIRMALPSTDTLVVVSAMPPKKAVRDRSLVGVVAIAGPGIGPGVLQGGSSRLPGFVSLIDLAPTVLDRLGVPASGATQAMLRSFGAPDALPFAGRPLGAAADQDAPSTLRALERDLNDAARARRPLTRTLLALAILFSLLAFVTIASGRGAPARASRAPRGWRDGLATAGVAVVSLPLALHLAGAATTGTASALVVALILASLVAVAGRATIGRDLTLMMMLAASAVVPLLDLALGGRLAMQSSLAFPLVTGATLRAIDANLLGVVLGGGLVGAALFLDRAAGTSRPTAAVVALAVVATWAFATYGMGADVGTALAVVPAFLILAAVGFGFARDRVTAVAIVAVTLTSVGAVTLTYGPSLWVENAPLVPLRLVPTLARARWEAIVDLAGTAWLPALLILVAAPLVLTARRRQTLDRGLWGRPHLRAALAGTTVAALVSLVAVRGGLVAAAFLALIASVSTLTLLLAPDR